jgi:membrane protease YdiL (CAAX protease family)
MESSTLVEERQRPPPPLEGGAWGTREVLQAIAGAVAAAILVGFAGVGIAVVVTGETEGAPIVAAGLAVALVFDLVLLAIAWALSVRKYSLSLASLGFRSLSSDRLWIPLAVGLSAQVIAVVFAALIQLLGADLEQDLEELFETRALLPLTGVVTLLAAPLAEETFFRGFVFRGLLGRLGLWRAAAVSGFLFALPHVTGADSAGLVVPFTLIGMLFAWVYYRTGSLWSSIGAHFLFNLISFVALVVLVEN